MQIEIKLDESCKEPNIIIHTDKMTEEVSQIVKLLSEEKPEVFAAIHENGEIVLLEQTEIIRIYAENERVYAKTKDGSYRLKARLYELEERLNKKITSEKLNRYWDYRNGGSCEKYIFHTQEWRLS